jgi:hypothetical protein
MGYSPFARYIAAFVLAFVFALSASGQAEYTANRDYSFSSFIVGSQLKTGLNTTNPAVIFGADATRHFKRLPWLTPSLEVRSGISHGKLYSEETFQSGIKVESRIGRFHPYADFLIGKGLIQFAGGHHDDSIVPSVGLGLDYTLNSRWSLKADYSHQSWDLGKRSPTFSPSSVSFGIVYRFNLGKE